MRLKIWTKIMLLKLIAKKSNFFSKKICYSKNISYICTGDTAAAVSSTAGWRLRQPSPFLYSSSKSGSPEKVVGLGINHS